MLVSLDDLHWSDPDSLGLLDFLAGELRTERVLFLASYRDVEVRRGHGLARVLGSLARQPHSERIPLRGLDRVQVQALATAIAGVPLQDALIESLMDLTEGSPFFVREIVTWLADEGRLQTAPSTRDPMTLPEGVRDALGRRLDSLSDPCNGALARGRRDRTGVRHAIARTE